MKTYILLVSIFLSSCKMQEQKVEKPTAYKIVTDGAAETKDLTRYESLGDKTFNRVQKYKIVALGDGAQDLHILLAKVTQKVGKKIIYTHDIDLLPISNGSYTLECSYYYDVKMNKSEDELDDPICTVEPIGVIRPKEKAIAVKG